MHNYQCLDCVRFFQSLHYDPDIGCPECKGLNWKYWGRTSPHDNAHFEATDAEASPGIKYVSVPWIEEPDF